MKLNLYKGLLNYWCLKCSIVQQESLKTERFENLLGGDARMEDGPKDKTGPVTNEAGDTILGWNDGDDGTESEA